MVLYLDQLGPRETWRRDSGHVLRWRTEELRMRIRTRGDRYTPAERSVAQPATTAGPPPRRRETMGHGGKITEIAREFVRRVIKSSLIARRDWITAVPDLISIWNPKDPTYVALHYWIPLPWIVSRLYSRCGLIVLAPSSVIATVRWMKERVQLYSL